MKSLLKLFMVSALGLISFGAFAQSPANQIDATGEIYSSETYQRPKGKITFKAKEGATLAIRNVGSTNGNLDQVLLILNGEVTKGTIIYRSGDEMIVSTSSEKVTIGKIKDSERSILSIIR